jgi:hypothetical protein
MLALFQLEASQSGCESTYARKIAPPILLAVAALSLSACAQTYAPGPYASQPPGMVQGRCKLAAINGGAAGGDVAAVGSPRFVGTTLGAAAASLDRLGFRTSAIYDACMEALGYVPADPRTVQVAQ